MKKYTKQEARAIEATAVCMIELWVDKRDGNGLRQMLFEPTERARVAEFAKNAILQGWVVQCC